jgi:hypothetical protein
VVIHSDDRLEFVACWGHARRKIVEATTYKPECELLLGMIQAMKLGDKRRLLLLGYGNFRQDHVQMHALLGQLSVSHSYRDGPHRSHNWHSVWVSEAVERLLGDQ